LNYVDAFRPDNTAVLGNIGWARTHATARSIPRVARSARVRGNRATGGQLALLQDQCAGIRDTFVDARFTLFLNGESVTAMASDGKPLPFFRNYYVGGVSSLPRFLRLQRRPEGCQRRPGSGSKKLVGSAEFALPFPRDAQ